MTYCWLIKEESFDILLDLLPSVERPGSSPEAIASFPV